MPVNTLLCIKRIVYNTNTLLCQNKKVRVCITLNRRNQDGHQKYDAEHNSKNVQTFLEKGAKSEAVRGQ